MHLFDKIIKISVSISLVGGAGGGIPGVGNLLGQLSLLRGEQIQEGESELVSWKPRV